MTDKKIVFMHIPKTGGTMIFNLLRPHFKTSEICPMRHDRLDSITSIDQYKLFFGHYSYENIQKYIKGDKILVTFLRDPVDRLVSEYYFLRLHQDMPISAEMSMHSINYGDVNAARHKGIALYLIADNNSWNPVLCNLLGGVRPDMAHASDYVMKAMKVLESFDFIGTLETFDQSVRALFRFLGLGNVGNIPRDMDSKELSKTMAKVKMDKNAVKHEIRTSFWDWVFFDQILYGHGSYLAETKQRLTSVAV